ncbi:hypothetical protein Scep_018427 [Stephania cephalantha]|uniref:DUF6821 domain-containing protein n=1 Tax=Stephania cephalantha TaxID=152367 RepID=A0AAP0I919_9MAGN
MEESGEWEILGSDGSPRTPIEVEEYGGGGGAQDLIKSDYFAVESEKKRGVEVGSSSDDKIGGFDVMGEVGVEGIEGTAAKVKDLGEFVVVSEEIRVFVEDDLGKEGSEENQAIQSSESELVDEGSEVSSERSGSSGDVVVVEGAIGELKSSEEEKKQMVWWKLPIELFKFCIFRVSPVWSFSVAAAIVGIVILRRRLQKMKPKSRSLQVKLSFDEKNDMKFSLNSYVQTVSRFNEAISVVRRVPIIRPALPAAGLSPWPMITSR